MKSASYSGVMLKNAQMNSLLANAYVPRLMLVRIYSKFCVGWKPLQNS